MTQNSRERRFNSKSSPNLKTKTGAHLWTSRGWSESFSFRKIWKRTCVTLQSMVWHVTLRSQPALVFGSPCDLCDAGGSPPYFQSVSPAGLWYGRLGTCLRSTDLVSSFYQRRGKENQALEYWLIGRLTVSDLYTTQADQKCHTKWKLWVGMVSDVSFDWWSSICSSALPKWNQQAVFIAETLSRFQATIIQLWAFSEHKLRTKSIN